MAVVVEDEEEGKEEGEERKERGRREGKVSVFAKPVFLEKPENLMTTEPQAQKWRQEMCDPAGQRRDRLVGAWVEKAEG